MLSSKKNRNYDELELTHLMAVRAAYRAAKSGVKVCIVTVYECGWETMLGQYHDVVIKYVKEGLIYQRVEDSIKPELQLVASDLDNELIEMGMI